MPSKYERILVTGGAGFIGSHIVDKLLTEELDVTVIDSLDTGSPSNIANHKEKGNFHFVKGDIRNIDSLKATMKDIDVVFHEAALASVTLSIKNPIMTNAVNVEGTLNVLKTASDLGVKRFIFASSGALYGKTKSPEKKEDEATNPTSPYGVSKLASENYVRIFYNTYGLETVCLRYFNVYGPRQRVDVHGSYGGVISIFINRLLRDMPPIVNGDGEQTRDFVYVDDVVQANFLALENKNAVGEAFNIGTGKNTSINEISQNLKRIMNKENLDDMHIEPRPTDIKHGWADISKAKKILGYTPNFSIEKGLAELVKWYTQNHKR